MTSAFHTHPSASTVEPSKKPVSSRVDAGSRLFDHVPLAMP